MGIVAPLMCPARVSSAACGVAVKVEVQITPLACRARWPACTPKRAVIASNPSWAVVTAPAYARALSRSRSRSSIRRILPVRVFGSSSTNSTLRG